MRTRDGRALVAVRDHYLSAEMMGINLRLLPHAQSFGIASFYAGIGGALYAHYLLFVSVEAFNILFSIQFLGMVIIGGLGSIMGSLMGAVFMTLLPEAVQVGADALAGGAIDRALRSSVSSISFLREMAIGAAIILFLIFEPDGLAHRWRMIEGLLEAVSILALTQPGGRNDMTMRKQILALVRGGTSPSMPAAAGAQPVPLGHLMDLVGRAPAMSGRRSPQGVNDTFAWLNKTRKGGVAGRHQVNVLAVDYGYQAPRAVSQFQAWSPRKGRRPSWVGAPPTPKRWSAS